MPAPPAPAAQPHERIPLDLKLAFGAPTFASAGLVLPIVTFLPKFYADEALIPLGWLSLAIAAGRAFDAITDPLMGWLSDRTRSRWGRRRPYLALGAPLCAVSLILLFSPPTALTGAAAAAWFGLTFVLYHVFHTMYLVPHLALGPELSLDYHERSTLYGIREGFLVAGTLVAVLTPYAFTRLLGSERAALAAFSYLFAAILVLLYGWLVLRVRERPEFQERSANPLVPGIFCSLRNAPFRLLLLTSILASVPGALVATLLRFFVDDVMQPEDSSAWFAAFLGTYFGAAALCLPGWLWIARRIGKKPAWLASFLFCGGGLLPTLGMGPGDLRWVVLCVGVAGAGFGAISALSLAIKADVIDYDELLTGKRREAQFGAFWSFIPKFIAVPGAALPVALLGSLGYRPEGEQLPEVRFAIRTLMALTPALFLGLACWVGRRLPVDEEIHRRVLEGISARGRGEAAFDPIAQRWLPPAGAGRVSEATSWFLDHFTRGELRRSLRLGRGRALREVLAWLAGSLLLLALSSLFLVLSLRGSDADPGVVAVGVGVLAGLALCSAVFHGLRVAPARRLREAGIPDEILLAHLGQTGAAEGAEPGAGFAPQAPGPARR